ncbi:SurA N-terminal domain-containing protein [Gracilibacillus orientalis]|uniref:SurA N-terminal domain-containing protein n=1 Tax=Gracilibacillus orientalis TaxID=334253 RepID=A0A1I4IRT1_9BACI|nr:SurA N-terminal domain-containing protein [Gracilibacillus orientalis]SFL57062.1 SurA N-terminal domain-containing protein [Gracilibacillus orientalis]
MKRILMLLMMMSLAIITVACGNDDEDAAEENNTEESATEETPEGEDAAEGENEEQGEPTEGTEQQDMVSDEELVEEDQAVATINGEEISGSSYNRMYPLVKGTLQQSGQDVEDTEAIKNQTLSELITQELIRQDAEEEGLTVEQEEVENEMAALEEQYGDEFATLLESSGFTKETYKLQLENDLLSSKYMESVLGIEVTDEEIKEYYETAKEQSEEELPPLEDVKSTIKQQLTTQKQQEKQEEIQSKIEELRENAEIEELI